MVRHLLDDAGETSAPAHEHDAAGLAFGPGERMLALVLLTLFALFGLPVALLVMGLVIRVLGGLR